MDRTPATPPGMRASTGRFDGLKSGESRQTLKADAGRVDAADSVLCGPGGTGTASCAPAAAGRPIPHRRNGPIGASYRRVGRDFLPLFEIAQRFLSRRANIRCSSVFSPCLYSIVYYFLQVILLSLMKPVDFIDQINWELFNFIHAI